MTQSPRTSDKTTGAYFRPSILGPDCSTPRTGRLREKRFQLGYASLSEPAEYTSLAERAAHVYLEWEKISPALGRARALYYVVEHAPISLEEDCLFFGGENPFFFNLMLPALSLDGFSRYKDKAPKVQADRLRIAGLFASPCFDGHITPGLEQIGVFGVNSYRKHIAQAYAFHQTSPEFHRETTLFFEASVIACDALSLYAKRYLQAASELADQCQNKEREEELRQSMDILSRVPENPAQTLREALQSYWIAYILVTLEMGGCTPGGGLGLGRMDQYLYPYYARDLSEGTLDRSQALELIEQFLLCFCHIDYFTSHQQYTPGSQASLGGIMPTGQDGFNDLTELILEASLRINMPAPYISLRLYKDAPRRFWDIATSYIASGLGFPVVNDEVIISAFLRHGRSLQDARDYICSCCYEHTIPGREAFHPSCCFVNLLFILELALNQGHSFLSGERLGLATPPAEAFTTFQMVTETFWEQVHFVFSSLTHLTNQADAAHSRLRRYPLMSLFIDDCLQKGLDVCAGGARYNLTGCVVAGLPNVVNSLAAIRQVVFEEHYCTLEELVQAMKDNFISHDQLHQRLLAVPKWGNGIEEIDQLAGQVAEGLYQELASTRNARGGRWQLGLYSFVANHWMGEAVGASADGRRAGEIVTRNLNPSWGSDLNGPTAVLESLSKIDFTLAPDGCSLDLRFNPADLNTSQGREKFTGFLKAFVDLGIMEMQISVVDTQTLLDAQLHPERYPHLLVRVAGYSARFVDLSPAEQKEIISRTMKLFS
jgi:pyruvate-formate lyase